ncbi:MAG: hypothetical protein KAX49_06895 [Halanaerobiales bacterium]|nr:hypothetical protein [Halanaerobiales bacterium]
MFFDQLDTTNLMKKIDDYFNTVTREEMKNDLEALGCIVEEIDDTTVLEEYFSEVVTIRKSHSVKYVINEKINGNFSCTKNDLGELAA